MIFPLWIDDDIIKLLFNMPIALFLGSGISISKPSCLPSGDQLRDDIFQIILDQEKMPEDLKKAALNIVKGYRLETFLFHFDDFLGISDRKFLDFMSNGKPNANHYNIAKLVKIRPDIDILTTNFDTFLEDAMINIGLQPSIFCRDRDFKIESNFSGVHAVFKLHGSIRDNARKPSFDSIQTAINNISHQMVREKRDFLMKILADNVIIFLGYSGRDEFDIQPQIIQGAKHPMIWVVHIEGRTPPRIIRYYDILNINRYDPVHLIIRQHPTTIIIEGNTQEILTDLIALLGGINKNSLHEIMPSPAPNERLRPKNFFIEKSPLAFIGLLLEFSRQFDFAWKLFNKAIENQEKKENLEPYSLAFLYRHRGICAKGLEYKEDALEDFGLAHDNCEQFYNRFKNVDIRTPSQTTVHQEHFLMMSQICEDFGMTHFHFEDLDLALDWMEKALKWSKRLVRPKQYQNMGRNMANLAIVHQYRALRDENQKEAEDSLNFFALAYQTLSTYGDRVRAAQTMKNWAFAYFVFGRAKPCFEKNLQVITLQNILGKPFSIEDAKHCYLQILCCLSQMATTEAEAKSIIEQYENINSNLIQNMFQKMVNKNLIFYGDWNDMLKSFSKISKIVDDFFFVDKVSL